MTKKELIEALDHLKDNDKILVVGDDGDQYETEIVYVGNGELHILI